MSFAWTHFLTGPTQCLDCGITAHSNCVTQRSHKMYPAFKGCLFWRCKKEWLPIISFAERVCALLFFVFFKKKILKVFFPSFKVFFFCNDEINQGNCSSRENMQSFTYFCGHFFFRCLKMPLHQTWRRSGVTFCSSAAMCPNWWSQKSDDGLQISLQVCSF